MVRTLAGQDRRETKAVEAPNNLILPEESELGVGGGPLKPLVF